MNDICEQYDATSIQQLTKIVTDEENGGYKDKDVFPVSIIQAIFDGKTGTKLDYILSLNNCIYLPFQGSREMTRLRVGTDMRHKGLIVVFRDYSNMTYTQRYTNSKSVADDYWQSDDNWEDCFTGFNNEEITQLREQLITYVDEKFESTMDALTIFSTKVVDELPEVGEANTLYFLTNQSTEVGNTCYEYVWLEEESRYELVGSIGVDLTGIEEELEEHQTLLDKISDELWPTTMSVSGGGGVYEIGTTQSVTIRVTITRDGETVTPTSLKINGEDVDASQTSFTYSATSTTTYTVTAIANGVTLTGSTTVTFVYASYFGVVDSTFSESDLASLSVDGLTKLVRSSKSYTGTASLSNQKTIYIYPQSFGTLSSIKDANNFDYINSYTRVSYTTNQWSLNGDSVAYYVYYLTDPTTVTSFTQTFA